MITKEKFREEIDLFAQRGIFIDSEPYKLQVAQPKEALQAGLNVVMRHEVTWLKEYDEVADWLGNNQGKGLLLVGPVGVGKTELCMKVIPIIIHLTKRQFVSRYSATDLLIPEKYSEVMKRTLLVIDDVGTEAMYNNYGTQHNVFSEVVDRIEKDGILLLASTNLSDNELLKKYGVRTMDRIRANMRMVIFDEPSLRGKFPKNVLDQSCP